MESNTGNRVGGRFSRATFTAFSQEYNSATIEARIAADQNTELVTKLPMIGADISAKTSSDE
jgi:hypothetical protein